METINAEFYNSLKSKPAEYRAVTQSDLENNEALRADNKKVGDMVWIEVKEDVKP